MINYELFGLVIGAHAIVYSYVGYSVKSSDKLRRSKEQERKSILIGETAKQAFRRPESKLTEREFN